MSNAASPDTTDDSDTTDDQPPTTDEFDHHRLHSDAPALNAEPPYELACEQSVEAAPALQDGWTSYLQKNPAVAFGLPAAGEPWRARHVSFGEGELKLLRDAGMIERGPRQRYGHSQSGRTYYVWFTKQDVAQKIATLDEPPTCPEGRYATGIQCLEAGETYTCPADDCECRFGRDRAEEILSGGGR